MRVRGAEVREPWLRQADDVAAMLTTDIRTGLSSAEARGRLARHGPNVLEAAARVSGWRRFLGQFADPLIYLLLAAAAVSVVAWAVDGAEGVPYEAIVIAVIVVLNAVLGFVQEARAEQAVAALQRMAAPTAGVVRDGERSGSPLPTWFPATCLSSPKATRSARTRGSSRQRRSPWRRRR